MHTKGPWKVMDVGDGYRIISGKKIIASIYCRDEFAPPNARLIAAAPELLEALEKILAEYPLLSFEEVVTICKEAIRKAKEQHNE